MDGFSLPGDLERMAPDVDGFLRRPSAHFVQFYEDDAALADAVADFVGAGLQDGGGAVLLAAPARRAPVAERLAGRGLDVEALASEGRLASLDAREALSSFFLDGRPDAGRFEETVGEVVRRVSDGGRRPVRAFGEMVALLWADGYRDAAIGVERLWNRVTRDNRLSLFCAYPMRGFSGADDARALLDVCGEHGHVLPSESYSTLGTPEDRLRAIALLQQKASALEVETARRRALEETLARRERELSHYLEHARESVLDVESGGRLRWANRAWLTRLGYERHELDHRSASDVLLSEAAVRDAWARLLRGDHLPEDTEVEFRAKDGRVVPMLVQSGMLRTVDGVLHMRWLLREPPATE